jgi:hypothetical protein
MGNMNQDIHKKGLLLILGILLIILLAPEVEAAWWDNNWNRCKTITINTDIQTDYNFVRINLTGLTIQTDGDDIRIINRKCSEGGQEIDYGLLRVFDSTSAEISFVANTTDSLNYSVYYNNPSAEKARYRGIEVFSLGDNQTMFSNFWYNITLQNYTGVLTNLTYKQGDPIFEGKPPDAGLFALTNQSAHQVFRGGNQQTKGAICQLVDNSSEYVRWTCTRHNYTQSYEFWDAPMIESDILSKQNNITRTTPFNDISPTAEACSVNFTVAFNSSSTTSINKISTTNCAVSSGTQYTGNLSHGLLLYFNASANSKNVFAAIWDQNKQLGVTTNSSFVFSGNSVGGLVNSLIPATAQYTKELFKIRFMVFNKTSSYSDDSYWDYYLNYSYQFTREKNVTLSSEQDNIPSLFKCIGITNETQSHILNFTIRVENNETNINGTFESTFRASFAGISTSYNSTYENSNINEINICSDILGTVIVDADIQYSAPGHDVREHYLYQKQLSNATTNISLYLLEIALGSPITLTVEDSNGLAQNGFFIRAERYDVGNNKYNTVAMGKTDADGKDLLFLRKNDALYRLSVEDGNITKYADQSPRKILADAITLIISPSTIKDILNRIAGIQYSLYNTSTSIILTYTNPPNDLIENCLAVLKYNSTFYDYVFNKCTALQSDTITYTIDGSNATYIGGYYVKLNPQVFQKTLIVRVYNIIEKAKIFGQTGLFAGTFLVLFLGSVGIAIGSIFSLVSLTIIGYVFAGVLGLIPITLISGTIGISLIIIGVIIILLSKT